MSANAAEKGRETVGVARSVYVVGACAMLAALVLGVTAASARQAATHTYASSFASPYGVPAGERGLNGIAVDESTGYVYLENVAAGIPLEKYSATGVPTPFTSPEANSSNTILTPGGGGFRSGSLEVDNSGNPATQGRIYIAAEGPGVVAFDPSGERINGKFPIQFGARDVAIEPGTGNIWVSTASFGTQVTEFTPEGEPTGRSFEIGPEAPHIALDSHGIFYLAGFGGVYRYDLATEELQNMTFGLNVAVDPTTDDLYVYSGGDNIRQYGSGGGLLFEFGHPVASTNGIATIAVNGSTGVVYRGIGGTVDIFNPGPSVVLPDVSTDPADEFQATSTTLRGTVDPDGVTTTECYFEWGPTLPYANKTTCAEGNVLTGTTPQSISLPLAGLTKGDTYHFRAIAANANGVIAGLDHTFTPSALPTFSDERVSDVHSDTVVLRGAVNPEGAKAKYHFEYGLADCATITCSATPVESAPLGTAPQDKSAKVTGLESNTTYHYRLVAESQSGTSAGTDHTFTTFPITKLIDDKCGNAHVRQQTGAALLLDCRAYELASAANAGGYDVESTLVPGQEPFDGYPAVGEPSKFLYGVHDGAIPGAGNPANRGLDSYVATRGETGWTTRYMGIPSDNPYAGGPFASNLLEASPGLDALAFGGGDICNPCFADGSTNIPLRLPDGSLVEGMAGSLTPGEPAEPAGHVGRYFSADGSHFVFGTAAQLESSGNENGDITIYERDLEGGGTEVVSTLPGGGTMTGPGTGELDVSGDGSRVVVGQRVSTDAAGNEYWIPYMHVAGDSHSIALAPGTTSGVLFDRMTADGSKVFFTSPDPLTGTPDTDNSADLYEAEVDGAGTLTLRLLSTGATPPTGNVDTCDPAANADGNNWDAVGAASTNTCGVVAIGGGGGVADDGTAYFLSPEKLDGSGAQDEPNLFVARPGAAPVFVATLEPDNPLVRDAVKDSGDHVYGDFQVTSDGSFAAFASKLSLTGFDNGGYYEVFRYDANGLSLICASCNPTNARAVGDSTLPRVGLGLGEKGAVFFDSADAIAPRDLDERVDAYEYENGQVQLISTGASRFDSRLLGIGADEVNAFFFTRDTLVPQDENGDLVKVYDARAGGGFSYVPPEVPCKASDECHGPGSPTPPAPEIRTIRGSAGNEGEGGGKHRCKGNRTRRHGRCVKFRHHHRHHARHGRNG